MSFTLSNLLQNIYFELSQNEPKYGSFLATINSSGTVIENSLWSSIDNPPDQDTFNNYYAFVVRDAGGGLAPEGEYRQVTAYNDTTYRLTTAAFSAFVGIGDKILLVKQDVFPIETVITSINIALQGLGDIPGAVDTSLTTAANQTEYALPAVCKRGLRQVWYQGETNDSNDNKWIPVYDRRNSPSAAGATGTLFMPQLPSGRKIMLVYTGPHPVLSAASDAIQEAIHPSVATKASILSLLEWYNRQDANQGSNDYYLWLEGEYRTKYLPQALMENPIKRPASHPRYFVSGHYVAPDEYLINP